MPTHNQAGIDFDSLKTSDGHDAQDVYAKDRGIAHNPRETEEHKEHAREEIHKMVEAERHTAAGLKGTILNPRASDHEKAVAAERLVLLPDWEDEPTTKTTTK
ncbi:hypothetical protein C6P46_005555 [Rhodotorula mucilaginosa]|uniref:Uncharacterized protein n=1 Tax=Rhodotorula mucilaginosa TaxID=5537 RepID=A0A9P6VXV7_RHOMI|nr:hypothetical protein C6P46_005555 [Rhodotorula mucilaginosa]TKA56622.1 hypothetical protein B0A53_01814 [Rhodotorula sp. CCFEE 5036]